MPPTYAGVLYGSSPEQNLDFWKAEGKKPSPLIINIHGGGWLKGQKEPLGRNRLYLNQGISVAQITYRFTPANPLPAPVMDAVRAVQFLRSKAAEWNIDPDRIIVTGFSAGGCSALWLATHDDVVNPRSHDPVERFSSRVSGVIATSAQTTIEPDFVRDWVGARALNHPMICNAGGYRNNQELFAAVASKPAVAELYHEYSPISHLSPDDPPILLVYGKPEPEGDIHGAGFGIKFKEKADKLGITNVYLLIDKDTIYSGYPGGIQKFVAKILQSTAH